MNRLLALCVVVLAPLAAADYSAPGPFKANRFSGSYAYGSSSFPYELHVPCSPGDTCTNAAPAGSLGGPFPVVALGHGFCNQPDNYRNFGALLASRGMVVVIPAFANFLCASDHAGNAQKLLAALDQVLAMGNAGGALSGRLDASRTALAGHSAGGLSALIAVGTRPTVKALVLLDGVDSGSGSRASPVPTLMLNTASSSCNSSNNNGPWYGQVAAGQPRSRMRIVGASHCDMQEPTSSSCSIAGCAGSSPASVRPVFLRHTAAWLSLYLGCDTAAVDTVQQGGADFDADVAAGRIADVEQDGVVLPGSCVVVPAPDAGQSPPDAGQGTPDAGAPQDAGQGGTTGADAGAVPDAGAAADAGATADAGEGGTDSADARSSPDAGEDGEVPVPAAGCGCTSVPWPLAAAWALLPAWALRRRRLA